MHSGVVLDDSGLHNDGKITGNIHKSSRNFKCGSAIDIRGGSLLFDGKTFKNRPREAVTIALWLKPESISTTYVLFGTEGGGAKYDLRLANGMIHWSHEDDLDQVTFSMDTKPFVNAGEWAHIGATYDSRTNRYLFKYLAISLSSLYYQALPIHFQLD